MGASALVASTVLTPVDAEIALRFTDASDLLEFFASREEGSVSRSFMAFVSATCASGLPKPLPSEVWFSTFDLGAKGWEPNIKLQLPDSYAFSDLEALMVVREILLHVDNGGGQFLTHSGPANVLYLLRGQVALMSDSGGVEYRVDVHEPSPDSRYEDEGTRILVRI